MTTHEPRMYELEYPSPDVSTRHLSAQGNEGPILVVALQGYADAGHAIDASARHLLAALDHGLLASFNNDELVDYRSRRPAVTIDDNRVVNIDPLELGLHVLRDNHNKPFLLLSGPEPDMRWSAFTDSVAELAERFGVERTVCLYSAPMAVPHTRPLMITAHGNVPNMVDNHFTLDSKIHVPGAAALMLEKTLDSRGKTVGGLTAHVPHYLASSEYPLATLRLLEVMSKDAGLTLPLGTLQIDADRVHSQLSAQVEDSPEISQVVQALESQYDRELEHYEEDKSRPTKIDIVDTEAVPSGDVLGAEFERFLASYEADSTESSTEEKPSNNGESEE